MEESAIIEQAQLGDMAAYHTLMKRHYRTVEKFAYQCGVYEDDIPDVTQEVFIKLFRFLHQFNREQFTTWLYKITLNTARDYYRKEKREANKKGKLSTYTAQVVSPSSESRVLLFEEDRELHQAILALDENYRMPLILFYFQELSYEQMSEVLNISMSTVKTRLFRAREKLKMGMETSGGVKDER